MNMRVYIYENIKTNMRDTPKKQTTEISVYLHGCLYTYACSCMYMYVYMAGSELGMRMRMHLDEHTHIYMHAHTYIHTYIRHPPTYMHKISTNTGYVFNGREIIGVTFL